MKIILFGPDTFRSKQKLQQWVNLFQEKKDPGGFNILRMNFVINNFTLDDFRRFTLSSGLFSGKRLIILENFFKSNKDEALNEEVGEFLKKTNQDDNSIIFWEEIIIEKNLSKTQKQLFIWLQKQKHSQEFTLLTPAKLSLWIKKFFEQSKRKIDAAIVNYLIEAVGPDLWRLNQEIQKLISLPEKNINLSLVKKIIPPKPDEEIWPLVDAIGEKDKRSALMFLREQIESGKPIINIFTMLVRQYRILIMIRETLEHEELINHFQLAKKIGLHPFVCQKAIRQAKNYSLTALKQIYQELAKIDLKIKTTSVDPEVLLDLLIIK